jgi:hypothetical protein
MKVKRLAMVLSPLLALALLLSLAALLMPATPAQANDEADPANQGNLEWAPMYLNGTFNKIVLTNCPETVAFAWQNGGPGLSSYAYEGDNDVCFTVTFRNLDTVDHDLNFTWSDGDITGADWTITPNPATIPAGETADVTFCCDLSNTTAYPTFPHGDWYGSYWAEFDVGYDDLYATYMDFSVGVLPTDGSVPVMPTVAVEFIDFFDEIYSVDNMRIDPWIEGMHRFNALFDAYSHDRFFDDYGCGLLQIYDETAWTHEGFVPLDSEMNILEDGSVEIIDHATLTGGLSNVTWNRTWHFTHDDPYLRVTDVYTNAGADPVSFSISTYLINWAEQGAAIRVPGVQDEWTMFYTYDSSEEAYYPTIPPIMADDMAAPVIFECDAAGYRSAEAPGAFGAVVFPTEVPYYDSTGGIPDQACQPRRGTALFFASPDYNGQVFSYRYDLAPGESKTLETYYVFTGGYPSSSYGPEKELYDVVYSLLSWPAPGISLSPDQGVGAFTIEGQGFLWNSEIAISWDEKPIAGAASSDWAGEFSVVVSVPEQTEPGNHTVIASDGTNSAYAIFTVSNVTGPQGPQGEQGIQGETGPAGANAPSGLCIAAIVLAAVAIVAAIYTVWRTYELW